MTFDDYLEQEVMSMGKSQRLPVIARLMKSAEAISGVARRLPRLRLAMTEGITGGESEAWPGQGNVVRALTLNLFQGIQDSLVHDSEGSGCTTLKGCTTEVGQPVMRQAGRGFT